MLRIARRSVPRHHPLLVARAPVRHFAHARSNLALAAAEKAEGTIASVFASLSGEQASVLPDRFAELKRSILADESVRAAVIASWDDLLSALRRYNAEIKRRRQGVRHVTLRRIRPAHLATDDR